MGLTKFAEGVWLASAPNKYLGWQLGTRMTVLRLGDGSLLIHSPIALDDSLKREIDTFGPVGHIVAPNLFHHLHAGDAARAFPEAKLHGAAGLRKKRPDLRLDALLGEQNEPAWRDDLDTLTIEGTLLNETIFWHKPSGTLVTADLIENFESADDWWTRLYLKAGGIHGKIGLSRMLRLAFRDRKKARRDIDQVLGWGFDRIVLAHGNPIGSNGVDALRETYAWLRG
ncbi:MAG: DUF4336 domain-containing protein [Deltaproteobacteria bacterium]|nr:DUF4336 domain-containing protein [Deltaproteobacteria bacterium]MBW2212648.1 DUF4336 domain-containing protein [Deltaproteobacteria bacterium]MBW2629513.1 DUF4336 domain-containing protein [Deltaproteobacteria bacterium]MBW2688196.1 DUF4336 domain-containing protein [Deltaproteobacteria bacterium]